MVDYLEEDRTINSAYYADCGEKKREVDSRFSILLLQDNAQAHTSRCSGNSEEMQLECSSSTTIFSGFSPFGLLFPNLKTNPRGWNFEAMKAT